VKKLEGQMEKQHEEVTAEDVREVVNVRE